MVHDTPSSTRFSWVWYPTAPNTRVSPTQARIKNSPSLPTNSPALLLRLTTMDDGTHLPFRSDTVPATTSALSQGQPLPTRPWPQRGVPTLITARITAVKCARMPAKYGQFHSSQARL